MSVGRFFKPETKGGAAFSVILSWFLIVTGVLGMSYCNHSEPEPAYSTECLTYKLVTDKHGQPIRFDCADGGF